MNNNTTELEEYGKVVFDDVMSMDQDGITFRMVMHEKIKSPCGKTLFTKGKPNTSLLGGTQMLSSAYMGSKLGEVPITTFDEAIATTLLQGIATGNQELFGMMFGLDGGAAEDVYPVRRNSKGFVQNQVIPMRMVDITKEDVGEMLTNYEIRSVDQGYAKYYVKRPTSITRKHMIKSGEVFVDNPDLSNTTEDVVTVITVEMIMTEHDMAEYFALVENDVNLRRFSSVMAVFGDRVNVSYAGAPYMEHRNIIVTNKINRANMTLGMYGTGTYVFNIYFK